jgi:ABC-type proline/glycine betaine transport system substrate-binding protein
MRNNHIVAAVSLSALAFSSPARAADCEGLKSVKIADTAIVSAEAIAAGDLTTAD